MGPQQNGRQSSHMRIMAGNVGVGESGVEVVACKAVLFARWPHLDVNIYFHKINYLH